MSPRDKRLSISDALALFFGNPQPGTTRLLALPAGQGWTLPCNHAGFHFWRAVSLRHLLTHTSGITCYLNDSDEEDRRCAQAADVGRFIWAWDFFGWEKP